MHVVFYDHYLATDGCGLSQKTLYLKFNVHTDIILILWRLRFWKTVYGTNIASYVLYVRTVH